jgi:hypothetical protein
MNLLMVTFALRNRQRDYSSFFVAVRGNAINWWHFIEQTILVSTNLEVQQFADQLYPHIETTDSVLVAKMTPHDFQGWLPKVAWDWLNDVSERIQNNEGRRLPRLTPPPSLLPRK